MMIIKLTRSTMGVKSGTLVCVDEVTGERLIANGNAGRVPDETASAFLEGSGTSEDAKPTRVDDVLAAVGEDKALAAAALADETAGKNRPTLVDKLQAIIDA